MDKLNSIIFIQQRFKFLYKMNLKKKELYNDIFKHIIKLSYRNESNKQLKIISNYTYNILNNELFKILENYNTISLQLNTIQCIIKLINIKNELKKLIFKIGTKSFNDIIYFYFNENNLINNKLKEELNFINNYFKPTKLIAYNKKNKTSSYEYDNINMIDDDNTIQYMKLKKKNITLFEHVNGCNIYFKIGDEVIIITGYFIKDSLNILRNTNILKEKYHYILKKVNTINIDTNFKNNYVEQLTIRDYFVYSSSQIIEKIQKDYFKIINYYKNNISYIVKDFLNKNIKEQLETIVLLLLINNNEIQYIAYLLYDLINNDSYLLKSQDLSDQIYNNLHWSLQKKFKNNLNNIEDKIKDYNFNIEEISYEKRIYLMKCKDSVKQKAIEKYKEVINKANDNSSKSQHYLDSILKIPFNIYKKEQILDLKDKYELKLIHLVSQVNDYINQNNINYPLLNSTKSYLYIDIVDIINKLKDFNNLNNNILDTYIKKNKNKDITSIIDTINKDQSIIKYKSKGNKKELLKTFNQFFSNKEISNTLKNKYYNIINVKSNPLNLEINILLNDWNKFIYNRKKYIENIDTILNKAIYSQNEAKNEIKRIIGQWINGKMTGYCLGFEGPPGIGKTSLAKKGIAKCLLDENGNSRPFSFIALGGSSNGSLLEGHNYTYVGSNYGKIIDILIQTKCMNPIIYIDELDKISNTENGKEIIGILTHLTDFTQNEHFNDKYFSGIEFDLSKVLFIFSYNDYNKLDPILADRIHRIKFNYLQKHEKIHIMTNYIIPELLYNIGYSQKNIIFDTDVIAYIIDNYTYEAGVRKIKEKIFEIIREINLDAIINSNFSTKIIVNLEYVKKIFANKPQISHKKINNENLVGVVNGLYATALGIGGIITIQVTKSFNDKKLDFTITGQQGDVMKESIYCSKTVAWNMIPDNIKDNINSEKSFGIHLHCPEAATPKDGPSAGGALTLAIISLLTNIKVKKDIGLTGEIDLKGNITKIGGLDLKIEGGKKAGLKTILIPLENKLDYDIIKKDNPQILDDIDIIIVSSIKEIVALCLEENDIDFNL